MSATSGNYNNPTVIHAGNLSYTEDKILIYTLYISNFPSLVDEKELRAYFEKFGPVSNLNIITKRSGNEKSFRFGFVNFSEPESASKALRHTGNSIRRRTFNVRPADSWKQPYLNKRYQTPGIENSAEEEKNDNASILKLPDDVFFIIFQYLPFNEQIKLSTICLRFQQAFKMVYKVKKSLNIDLVQGLTLMDFRIGLQQIGEYIHHIKFHSSFTMKNFTRFIVFVSQFCKNLRRLQLDTLRFQYADIFRKISQNLRSIQTLELRNCSITDSMLNLISSITTIEDLDLTKNCELTGQHLYRFSNLKRLILNDCVNIQPKYFVQMCTQTVKLQTLNIRRCERLNISAFETMISYLKELNTLTICTCYYTNEIEKLAGLEALKNLTINVSIVQPDKLLKKLSELKSDQLETLIVTNYFKTTQQQQIILEFQNLKHIELPFVEDLSGDFLRKLSKLKHLNILSIPGCIKITELDLLNFIEITPNIEQIDISQTQITNEFIQKLCDLLNKINRRSQLKLIVGSTLIQESIKNDPKFITHRNKLKVLFQTSDYVFEMFGRNNMLFDDEYDDEDDDDDFDNFSTLEDSDSDGWYDFYDNDEGYDPLFLQAMYQDEEDPYFLFK